MSTFSALAATAARSSSGNRPEIIRHAWGVDDNKAWLLLEPSAPADVLEDGRLLYPDTMARRPDTADLVQDLPPAAPLRRMLRCSSADRVDAGLVRAAIARYESKPSSVLAGALTEVSVHVLGSRLYVDAVLRADKVKRTRAKVRTTDQLNALTDADRHTLLTNVSRLDLVWALLALPHEHEAKIGALGRLMNRYRGELDASDYRRLVRWTLGHTPKDRHSDVISALTLDEEPTWAPQVRKDATDWRPNKVPVRSETAPVEPTIPPKEPNLDYRLKSCDPQVLHDAVSEVIGWVPRGGVDARVVMEALTNPCTDRADVHRLLDAAVANPRWVPNVDVDLRVLFPGDEHVEQAWSQVWAAHRMANDGWDSFGGVERAPQLLPQWLSADDPRSEELARVALARSLPAEVLMRMPTHCLEAIAEANATNRTVINWRLNAAVGSDATKAAILASLFDGGWAGTFAELLDTVDALAA